MGNPRKRKRPQPPLNDGLSLIVPAQELESWARETFIDPDAVMLNEDHQHLRFMSLGFLWAYSENKKKGRAIVGHCEVGEPKGSDRWKRDRATIQLKTWFGQIPDFIITISAAFAESATDRQFCALVEHELYHAGQAVDGYGCPRFFQETGLPVPAVQAHDIEEFLGVAERYGVLGNLDLGRMAQVLNSEPTMDASKITGACGVCQKVKS